MCIYIYIHIYIYIQYIYNVSTQITYTCETLKQDLGWTYLLIEHGIYQRNTPLWANLSVNPTAEVGINPQFHAISKLQEP